MEFRSLEEILHSNDESLFAAIRYNPKNVLHQLLPPPKQISYNLLTVDMALLSLSYRLNVCTRTSFTVCCTCILIFINEMR